VFQQLEVPKKITVAWPGVIVPAERFDPRIGKLGLESSEKERLGANVRSDAAFTRLTRVSAACTTNASTKAYHYWTLDRRLICIRIAIDALSASEHPILMIYRTEAQTLFLPEIEFDHPSTRSIPSGALKVTRIDGRPFSAAVSTPPACLIAAIRVKFRFGMSLR
jgi:hypothetical protein